MSVCGFLSWFLRQDITHVYTKARREFGKPCQYKLTPPEILVHIPSTPEDADQWTPRVFTHVPIQTAPDMTEHSVNTESVPLALAGVHHSEGGWPKEIDHREEEHTARYRKKVERDQKFLDAVEATSSRVTSLIQLNNALDITTAYFPSDNIKRDSVASMQSVAVMRDVCRPTRAARYISWGPMVSGTLPPRRVAVSYSTLDFQKDLKSGAKRFQTKPQLPTSSYVWDLSNPGSPEFEVANPTSAITVLKFSPKDSHVLVGGMYNGLIGVWDMRY
ncbi:hypothetical protein KIPB_008079 [Kipferlia bialata]|uniref:Uncharacterized protein n=1 Tax=Kipferlia bialata TaxID=797122 RepID=A0A9K3GL14_9EUKA|nr:hypothetical protein KIPB_008079 [Kipferlia bialata]|eukprot:g8079.t1